MCNVMTIDTTKKSRKELENCTVSLEVLFLMDFKQFIEDMQNHENNYAEADTWLTNKRNEDYLLEKMEILRER